jgi:hypothetical protein
MLYLTDVFSSLDDAPLVAGYYFVLHLVGAGLVIASSEAISCLGFKAAYGLFAAAAALFGLFPWILWIRNRYQERHLQ